MQEIIDNYILWLKSTMSNISVYSVFYTKMFGQKCPVRNNIVCELYSYQKEIERLDILEDDDLEYFENMKYSISQLLKGIDLNEISNITYFKYPPIEFMVTDAVENDFVSLSWNVVDNGEFTYVIERSSDNITYTEIAQTINKVYTDDISGLGFTNYYYRISILEYKCQNYNYA